MSELSVPDLIGSFFYSGVDVTPHPGIMVLGGSEGGRPRYLARLLATQGFTTLALQYFGRAPLPRHLVEVPLEQLSQAAQWLRERPECTGSPIGIIGASKGAELALLVASTMPEKFGCVVAFAPSAVSFAGVTSSPKGRRRSSWSHQGRPVAFVPYGQAAPRLSLQGLSVRAMYEIGLDDTQAVQKAMIPVERIQAPIMLISGARDRMWPSSKMAAMINTRLAEHGCQPAHHLDYPNAGHSFVPWAPGPEMSGLGRIANRIRLAGFGPPFALGGKPRANREALKDVWPRVVEFFQEHLH